MLGTTDQDAMTNAKLGNNKQSVCISILISMFPAVLIRDWENLINSYDKSLPVETLLPTVRGWMFVKNFLHHVSPSSSSLRVDVLWGLKQLPGGFWFWFMSLYETYVEQDRKLLGLIRI